MGEVERITKTVDMSGEQVEIVMTKMMTPCTQEEFEAMSLEEREHAKIQPALNQRTYSPEEGIICMQDIPVKMRDGVTIVHSKDRQSGRSWGFRPTPCRTCPNSRARIRVTGAATAMRWQM